MYNRPKYNTDDLAELFLNNFLSSVFVFKKLYRKKSPNSLFYSSLHCLIYSSLSQPSNFTLISFYTDRVNSLV